jgi:geranylgeranylglycerol-phosphate geranylgeranyltransferase
VTPAGTDAPGTTAEKPPAFTTLAPMNPWIRLLRPWNALIAGAAVWLGWVSLYYPPGIGMAAWGSLAMFLLVAAGNVHNDVLDVATDRVNRPGRPLASGRIGVRAAHALSVTLYLGAIFAAWLAAPLHGLLAALMALLLVAYNRVLKALPVAGNLTVAVLCAIAVYFTEFPGIPADTLPALAFAFIVTLARELVKDAEDFPGDKVAGLSTLAVVTSPDVARRAAFGTVVILLLLLPWPMLAFGHRWPYALGVIILVGPFIVPLVGELSRPEADYTRCQKLLKGVIVGGMLALLAGVAGR